MKLENWTIRAPRFSQGGAGYVTADTLEITINGAKYPAYKHPELCEYVAKLINTGHANRFSLMGVLGRYLRGENITETIKGA